jgi:hypothetical protein
MWARIAAMNLGGFRGARRPLYGRRDARRYGGTVHGE